jgi:hypothetical protein
VTPARAPLVLPRPNLGPDPLAEPWPSAWWLAGLAGVVVVGLVIWRLRGRRRGRKVSSGSHSNADVAATTQTPEDALVTLGLSVRQELIDRLGQAWRAKTTEELSASAQLSEVFGPEPLSELVRFLDRVDQLKFARVRSGGDSGLDSELEAWRPRIDSVCERLSKYKPKANGAGEKHKVMTKSSRTGAVEGRRDR